MGHYFPEDAYTHFKIADPVMAKLMEQIGPVKFQPGGELFDALISSIVSQVISTAAAATVMRRLRAYAGEPFQPELLTEISQASFREMGIGAQKFGYISHAAKTFRDEPDRFAGLEERDDATLIKELCKLKGVGKWTSQMILIFNLGRQDVFAEDDLGLRNAIQRVYGIPLAAKAKAFSVHAEIWAPHRTAASIYLWNSIKRWD